MAAFENLNSDKDKKELNGQKSPLLQNSGDTPEQNEVIGLTVQAKNVRQTSLILAGTIVIAFAVIWFIHKKAAPAQVAAAAADSQMVVETAIAKLTGIKTENVGQVDQLVKKFYEFVDFEQVAAQQLRKNPFNLSQALPDAAGGSSASKGNVAGDVQNEAKKIQIQSIMQSKYGNCCMINDTLLYKGDKINNFEIVEIGDNFIQLRAGGGQNITLYLQTE